MKTKNKGVNRPGDLGGVKTTSSRGECDEESDGNEKRQVKIKYGQNKYIKEEMKRRYKYKKERKGE